MTEFDHPVPEMESIADVLQHVRDRAAALPDGAWIQVRQVFITRLREQRYPRPAPSPGPEPPREPVVFSTGPDASVNSLALRQSIDRNSKAEDDGGGKIEKDPATGEPTGILRRWTRFVKPEPSGRKATEADRYRRTLELFRDYVASGITAVGTATPTGTPSGVSPLCESGTNCRCGWRSRTERQRRADRRPATRHPRGGGHPLRARGSAAPDHRRQDVSGRRDAHRQRLCGSRGG